MKRRPQPAVRHPFGERFEVVHRLDGFDFDDGFYATAAILRRKHHVGKHRRRTRSNRCVLFRTGVDADIEATAKLGLEKTDDPVVFELLADRPYEDGAHEIATITWMKLV